MNNSESHTQYRQELRQRILEYAMNEFETKGIRAVKMDDIARHLTISKRTMYEVYDNKEQILLEGMKKFHEHLDQRLREFAAQGDLSVMDILAEFFRIQIRRMANVNPVFFEDLQRYESVRDYLKKASEKRNRDSAKFFRTGVEEGFFLDTTDYQLVCQVSTNCMQYIMMNQMYRQYDFSTIFRHVVCFFLRGNCTQKGVEALDKIINSELK